MTATRHVDLPSPYVAAASSFGAFTVGGLVPLLPLFFGAGSILVVALVSAVALFVSGGLVATLTTRSPWFGGARQLVLGLAAAAATYGLGSIIGSNIG